MMRSRTKIEAAAGKLISAIQKEWGKELGDPIAYKSEEIMNKAHCLLQAAKNDNIASFLNDATISEFLGLSWVERHQLVKPLIENLEIEEKNNNV
jgi:hypothetical protein